MHQHLELPDTVRAAQQDTALARSCARVYMVEAKEALRLFAMVPEAAYPSPKDITMGVLLFIACFISFAEQKQRPTTSLRLNVSTSMTRKLTPSPAVV